jgi:hypothetical protein
MLWNEQTSHRLQETPVLRLNGWNDLVYGLGNPQVRRIRWGTAMG